MHPEEVRQHLHTQPFEPFRIFMSDGSHYDVPHPELTLITQRRVFVAIPTRTGRLPERSVFLDPIHITRIEPIRNGAAVRRQRRRRKK